MRDDIREFDDKRSDADPVVEIVRFDSSYETLGRLSSLYFQ